MEQPIPNNVRRFLRRYTPSVLHLETVLYLRLQHGMAWSARELAKAMMTNERVANDTLKFLCSAKLLTRITGSVPRYKYEIVDEDRESALTWLDAAYPQFRFRVIDEIYSTTSALHEFSSAFGSDEDG